METRCTKPRALCLAFALSGPVTLTLSASSGLPVMLSNAAPDVPITFNVTQAARSVYLPLLGKR